MKFVRKHRVREGVNLTPLIDVVFLLLIFFMVSTTFKQNSQLSLELPTASVKAEVVEPVLTVQISHDGKMYLNERVLRGTDVAAVRAGIAELKNLDRDGLVTLEADQQASHQAVIVVLDALGQEGFSQVQMATSENE